MAHTQDVIFTEQGLDNFIQLIKQNPQMVYKVRAATDEEILNNNYVLCQYDSSLNIDYYLKTQLGFSLITNFDDFDETSVVYRKLNLNEGYIPGKGITIIQANGDKASVPVGSDVKVPNFQEVEANIDIPNGTISFIVDESIITIPIKGIIKNWDGDAASLTEDRQIPSKEAVTNYVNTYVKEFKNYIPGVYTTMDADDNAPIWKVQKTATDATEVSLKAVKVYGAVFNDYAEYRTTITADPGRVVVENGDGSLSLATKRLQLGTNIVSDTYGFAIGKTANAQTPIAVCGRVLAYPYEELKLFTPGAAVCSGPNGTVSVMTREEIREWPDAIIGYVSEIPTYEYWGTDNIKVDGRLWIKLA